MFFYVCCFDFFFFNKSGLIVMLIEVMDKNQKGVSCEH
jgi:hypothetical protein